MPFFPPTLFVSVKKPCYPWWCHSLQLHQVPDPFVSPSFISWQSYQSSAPPWLHPLYYFSIFSSIRPFSTFPYHFLAICSPGSSSLQPCSLISTQGTLTFTTYHVNLCWSIQSLCWRVWHLPSVFNWHSSFSSPYTKAYSLALIFISHNLYLWCCVPPFKQWPRIFQLYTSCFLLPYALSLSLSTISRSLVFISICLSSCFPTFLLSFLLLSQWFVRFLPALLLTLFPKSCLSPLQVCFNYPQFFQFPS